MKLRNALLSAAVLAAVAAHPHAFAADGPVPAGGGAVIPADVLTCESRSNPLAIETAHPRFSWKIPAGRSQAAYQILVASTPEGLRAGTGDLWDSGKVASGISFQVPYAGKPLASGQRAYWRVTLFDDKGSMPSDTAQFAMGFLQPADWKAQWIGFPNDTSNKGPLPAPCFRKEFAVAKPVARATVHISGVGQYELTLNGRKVGDAVLGPAWTMYSKHCSYDSFDVTRDLQNGPNALGIMLGNGMFNVLREPGRFSKFIGTFGNPQAILQLDIEHTDGTHTLLTTDPSWKAARGPVVYNHPYGGEDYDATKEMPGWDRPGFDDSSWVAVEERKAPGEGASQLIAATNPPVKIQKAYSPVKVMQPQPNVFVYDMGQNLSGWPRIKVKGPAGATVRLIPTELLYRDGTVGGVVDANRGLNWYSYTLKGTGEEEWRPRFGSYGFRYLQVTGAKPPEGMPIAGPQLGGIGRQPPELGTVPEPTAQVVDIQSEWIYADARVDGTFVSSDETLNRIHRLINAAVVSNTQSILTDCPHREKLGWLEQAHLMADSIFLNYDMSGLYPKICMDIRDSQTADGLVPTIAPEYTEFKGSFRDSPEWGATAILAPWTLYTYYGDRRTLETHYDAMKRYMTYLTGKADRHILSHGLGDWYDVTPEGRGGSKPKNTTEALTGTAIYFQDAITMAKAARLLGREDDAKTYAALAEEIKSAFNGKFYTPENYSSPPSTQPDRRKPGQYEFGSQTANAMPLALGMVPADKRAAVTKALVDHVKEVKYRVTAGDVGFVYVVNALIDAGEGDVMYRMLTQSDGPGYVMQLRNGATALTEIWNGGNSSNNHLMLGHGELWFYRGLTGIQAAPDAVGFEEIVINPQVVRQLAPDRDGNVYAKATYQSVRGTIESGWSLKGNTLTMNVTVPPTATATVFVPAADAQAVQVTPGGPRFTRAENGAAVYTVQPGTFTFTSTLP
jgi:hypothetical protein